MKDSTKIWLKAAIIRALRTFGQAAIAAIGVDIAANGVTWKLLVQGLSVGAIAAIMSILTSLKGLPEVEEEVKEAKADEQKIEELTSKAKEIIVQAVADDKQAKVEAKEEALKQVEEKLSSAVEETKQTIESMQIQQEIKAELQGENL